MPFDTARDARFQAALNRIACKVERAVEVARLQQGLRFKQPDTGEMLQVPAITCDESIHANVVAA